MTNKEVNADIKSLKFIFERNKFYIFPVIIILFGIILFFQFVIPQFNTLLSVSKEAQVASMRLGSLKENLDLLANISENSLDSQLKIVNLALPANKDFSAILNDIYYVSGKTGVNLGSFSFQIGDLSESGDGGKLSTIDVSLPVSADIAAINNFAETISNTFPLSEVSLIKIEEGISTISLSFYYKPILSIGSITSGDTRINPISQKGLELIKRLSGFENAISSFSNQPLIDASQSAKTPNPF